MKKLKLNSSNFQGAEVLSREQLKKVLGGAGSIPDGSAICKVSLSCKLYVRELGETKDGECFYQIGGDCWCGYQLYRTDPGTVSTCWYEF